MCVQHKRRGAVPRCQGMLQFRHRSGGRNAPHANEEPKNAIAQTDRGKLPAGLILMAAILSLAAQAQPEAAQNSIGPLSGSVVDAAGEPAAGATVWLLSGSDGRLRMRVLAQTTADRKGEFHFGAVPWDRRSPYDSPPVLSRKTPADGSARRESRRGRPEPLAEELPDHAAWTARTTAAGWWTTRAGRSPRPRSSRCCGSRTRQQSFGTYQVLMLPPKLQEQLSTRDRRRRPLHAPRLPGLRHDLRPASRRPISACRWRSGSWRSRSPSG